MTPDNPEGPDSDGKGAEGEGVECVLESRALLNEVSAV